MYFGHDKYICYLLCNIDIKKVLCNRLTSSVCGYMAWPCINPLTLSFNVWMTNTPTPLIFLKNNGHDWSLTDIWGQSVEAFSSYIRKWSSGKRKKEALTNTKCLNKIDPILIWHCWELLWMLCLEENYQGNCLACPRICLRAWLNR